MADIQAMYHQVNVAKLDVDFLRFLWWPNGKLTQHLTEYRMTLHLFAAVSSPSCASFALRKTSEDNRAGFPAHVTDTIKHNFYVDDCLKSLPSEAEAMALVRDLTAVCQLEGFQLVKRISNSRSLLESINVEKRAKKVKELDFDRDNLSVERTLGFLAPFILPVKLMLQNLCRLSYSWDDYIPQNYQQPWVGWLEDLRRLSSVY